MSTELGGIRVQGQPMRTSQLFLAIDVGRFMPLEEFQKRMQTLVAMTKSSKTAAGYDEVLVAGDAEWRAEEQRRRDGIPLSDGVWRNLTEAARKLAVPLPE
jgi:LDH2 family malate/lactate/ureidoglycolate dehydrogenase